ncbi:MAG: prephenate dehydrogenase, partial [Candidatus Omnitrophica bacterium]|nr:prephenate dehydrogenase [Candidatus Omnitrophota bacterium]
IGLAIKRKRAARRVIGIFRRESTMKKALKRGAVDRGTMDLRSGVRDADLIVIAAPVHSIPALAAQAIRYAKKGAVITDAGSTKGWIVGKIEGMMRHYPGVSFIGSHPMAGSEHAGVEFAKNDLLEGSPCIVTVTPRSDSKELSKVSGFWRSLGARVKLMSPSEHDRTVSMISHLPHVVAFSLAGAVPDKDIACSAEGFKDTTRVASSDPDLWADIFLTNRSAIKYAGRLFSRRLSVLLRAVEKNDRRSLLAALKEAKSKRDRFLYGKKA